MGTPLKRNEDGNILIDIGYSKPLIASKSSLYFMNENEHCILNELLNKKEPENKDKSIKDIIYETIHMSKKYPERKKQTYFRPKYMYPYDFEKERKKREDYIPYDIGVGSEIRPQDFSKPLEPKIPKFLRNKDKMEFLVTDFNPYTNEVLGEFFSVNIVEAKRRIYSCLYLESLKRTSQLVPYDAIITQLMDSVVKVQIMNGKYSEMFGVNAYTMASQNDKVGDRIKVYLGGSDVGLQQVYLFRNQIPHPMLKKENLKILMDSIVKYYARTGKWFRAEVDKVMTDMVVVRLFEQGLAKYSGYVIRDQLPYNFPEGLLHEAFMKKNTPAEYFQYKDAEINIGKLNYIYHYDNSIFVRVSDLFIKGFKNKIETVNDLNNTNYNMCLTTKNYYKPVPEIVKYFLKMFNQEADEIDIKTNMSYPCIILGNDGGYLYFAINDKFKANFTVDDEYRIGLMEVGQFAKNIAVGTIVHAKFARVVKYDLESGYAVDMSGRKKHYKKLPIVEWFSKLTEEELRRYGLKNKKSISLLMMNNYIVPNLWSPQFNEFLFMQPALAEIKFADYHEAENAYESILSTNTKYEPLTSASTTKSKELPKYSHKENVDSVGEVQIRNRTEIVATPVHYARNEELRQIYIKENLDPYSYRKVIRNIESAKSLPHLTIREFFINAKGMPYWEFLDSLKHPLERRKIPVKEALDFERSILKLLSLYQSMHLETIYEMIPKQDVMFASIVPSSLDDTYFKMSELREYYDLVRRDFVMDRTVNRSIVNTLKILSHPNFSFLAQLRSRHKRMLNDVFFYSSKSINYDSFINIVRPEVDRSNHNNILSVPNDEEEATIISMAPYTDIVRNPKIFVNELELHGLSMIRKLYSTLLDEHQPLNSKYIKPIHVDDSVMDVELSSKDPEFNDPDIIKLFKDIDLNEYALNKLDGSKESLKLLAKAWKKLNKFPDTVSMRDVQEYLDDIKKVNRVHGIKLPIL